MIRTGRTTKDSPAFAETLIAWWTRHGRDFPWRRTKDPFKVLVAEMLLQRSRSGSVAKVYLELFERWPSALKLAGAGTLEIEGLISPLGFKRRASKLKEVAAQWCERASLPNSAKQLQELPGVGPYTANATAVAMSWDSEPCVDSVSIRVLRRYQGDLKGKHSDQEFASAVYSGTPVGQWKQLNWAVLDLASALCMPRIPRCQGCPLEARCNWAQRQRQKTI